MSEGELIFCSDLDSVPIMLLTDSLELLKELVEYNFQGGHGLPDQFKERCITLNDMVRDYIFDRTDDEE